MLALVGVLQITVSGSTPTPWSGPFRDHGLRPWSQSPSEHRKPLEIKGFLGLERPFLDLVSQTPRPRGRGRPLFAEQKEVGKRRPITFFVFGTLSATFRSLFLTLLSPFSSFFAKLLLRQGDLVNQKIRNHRSLATCDCDLHIARIPTERTCFRLGKRSSKSQSLASFIAH